MTETLLKDTLRVIVRQYGFEQVNRILREFRISARQRKSPKHGKTSVDNDTAPIPRKKRVKPNAVEYVTKVDLSSENEPIVVELAKRFDSKTFLPTFGDIRNFCQIYRIDEPASKTRASAIPRIFKFISSMETDGLQRILDEEMFSGPSRLGPIADEIRRSGRTARINKLSRRSVSPR